MRMRVLIVGLILLLPAFAAPAHAAQIVQLDSAKTLVNQAGQATYGSGYEQRPTLYQTIGNVIRVMLQLIGIAFVILTIYAGFLWMTAGGNSDQIDKAKTLLIQAIIGLVIILAAYGITVFVFNNVGQATSTNFNVLPGGGE